MYRVIAQVNQLVTKTIVLEVNGKNHAEVIDTVKEFLQDYPDETRVKGVRRAVTSKVDHTPPREIEFLEVKEVKGVA